MTGFIAARTTLTDFLSVDEFSRSTMALWTSSFVLRDPGLCNPFMKSGVLLFFRLDWTYSSSARRKGDGSSFSWRSPGAVDLSSISISVFSIFVQTSSRSSPHVLNGGRHFYRSLATSRFRSRLSLRAAGMDCMAARAEEHDTIEMQYCSARLHQYLRPTRSVQHPTSIGINR